MSEKHAASAVSVSYTHLDVYKRQGKAISVPVTGVVNGIPQTAGLAHHRNGAIAAGDHLGQTAGFGAGRHQEDIGTGIDVLGQLGIEADVHTHTCLLYTSSAFPTNLAPVLCTF